MAASVSGLANREGSLFPAARVIDFASTWFGWAGEKFSMVANTPLSFPVTSIWAGTGGTPTRFLHRKVTVQAGVPAEQNRDWMKELAFRPTSGRWRQAEQFLRVAKIYFFATASAPGLLWVTKSRRLMCPPGSGQCIVPAKTSLLKRGRRVSRQCPLKGGRGRMPLCA